MAAIICSARRLVLGSSSGRPTARWNRQRRAEGYHSPWQAVEAVVPRGQARPLPLHVGGHAPAPRTGRPAGPAPGLAGRELSPSSPRVPSGRPAARRPSGEHAALRSRSAPGVGRPRGVTGLRAEPPDECRRTAATRNSSAWPGSVSCRGAIPPTSGGSRKLEWLRHDQHRARWPGTCSGAPALDDGRAVSHEDDGQHLHRSCSTATRISPGSPPPLDRVGSA